MQQAIYKELKRVARTETYTTYAKIAPLAGLDMDSQVDRNQIAEILDEISTHEYNQGRPLLSAVVIRADEGKPGQGFFRLARNLGVYSGADDRKFWLGRCGDLKVAATSEQLKCYEQADTRRLI